MSHDIIDKEKSIYQGELSSSIIDRAGTYISEAKKTREVRQKNKQKSANEQAYEAIQELQAELDELWNDLDKLNIDYIASIQRQRRLEEMLKNNDSNNLREMFTTEYYMNADQVKNMSVEQILTQAKKFNEQEELTQATLQAEIEQVTDEFKNKAHQIGELSPELKNRYLEKLTAIQHKYEAVETTDFDQALNHTQMLNKEDKVLYNTAREVDDRNELELHESLGKRALTEEQSSTFINTPNIQPNF